MRSAVAPLAVLGLVLLAACAETGVEEPVSTAGTAVSAAATVEPVTDWSTQLQLLLPAIDACLASVKGAVGVTKGWIVETRFGGARVLTSTKDRFDCIASKDGAMVLLTEKVPATSQIAGELEPLFTPTSASPPRTSCYETRDALDAGGARIGWLSYETCRHPRRLPTAAQGGKNGRAGDS
ncbi:MAG: hypothetical protein U1E45_03770 [Geminicoccaceae bacterium]